MSVATIVRDVLAWWSEGTFRLISLGALWSHIDMRSLSSTQMAVQNHASPSLWAWLVRPILLLPAFPAFAALGLVFLWLGGRRGPARPEQSFLGGSRPPRRKRSRGLS
ncbi:hypothetical protein [Reyranella sp.]|uniref:hypothetical protein n=1 Tax=Reyranella sp. TaxID=1929291 RepID=UPI003BAB64F2